MEMRFKEYLLEQKETFFEEKYPSKEEKRDEKDLSEGQTSPQKNDSKE